MKYEILREAETNAAKAAMEREKEIFRTTIIARTHGGTMSEEEQFIYELIFKPNDPGLKLKPEHIQLLLNYFEEILKQVERN